VGIVLGLAVTLFAAEQRPTTSTAKLIRLKSDGTTIAELKLPKGTEFEIASPELVSEKTSGRITAKGGITIAIKHAGASPVTVKADEIEVISERQ